MSLEKINSALVQAYMDIGLGLPTAHEMVDFRPPTSSMWARVLNAPSQKSVDSLGVGGMDNITGFFQIDIFTPENSGTESMLEVMDRVIEQFKPGKRFYYEGQEVKVRRNSLTPARRSPDSASYRATVTVYWDSPTIR